MPPYSGHAITVAVHAIYALACLREDELVDPILTYLAFEAMSMVSVVPRHDCFVQNGQVTDVATVGTVGADGRTV